MYYALLLCVYIYIHIQLQYILYISGSKREVKRRKRNFTLRIVRDQQILILTFVAFSSCYFLCPAADLPRSSSSKMIEKEM